MLLHLLLSGAFVSCLSENERKGFTEKQIAIHKRHFTVGISSFFEQIYQCEELNLKEGGY